MRVAWFHAVTGEVLQRGTFRCSDLRCRGCGPEKVARFLTKLADLWGDQTVWLGQPQGRWTRKWDGLVQTWRNQGNAVEQMAVQRRDIITGEVTDWLWTSIPLPFPQGLNGEPWVPLAGEEALRAVRDQLCLPGPTPYHFPPPRSKGWRFPSTPMGKQPPDWKRVVVDPRTWHLLDAETRSWAKRTGTTPGKDTLASSEQWLRHLVSAGIVLE